MSLTDDFRRAWAERRARIAAQDAECARIDREVDEPVPYLPTDRAWDCQIREASRQERMEAAMASVFDWTFSAEDRALLTAWMTGGAGMSPLHEPSAVERGWAL